VPRRIERSDYYQKGDPINMELKHAVVLLSGGLDSSTLLYDYADLGYLIHALSFDYGQRHRKELESAALLAHRAGARHSIVLLGTQAGLSASIEPLAAILGPSSLTSNTPVPDGHYADESMKVTVVPNRNAIMLSIAYGVAVAEGAEVVAFAAHAGDHAIYPDCRPEFVAALAAALTSGNRWDETTKTPRIATPYLMSTKSDIAVKAQRLSVPIEDTWSCYKGGDVHCGTCGTCTERREALIDAALITGRADPTEYANLTTEFLEASGVQ